MTQSTASFFSHPIVQTAGIASLLGILCSLVWPFGSFWVPINRIMGIFLCIQGAKQLYHWGSAAKALQAYDWLAHVWNPYAYLYPVLSCVAGICMLFGLGGSVMHVILAAWMINTAVGVCIKLWAKKGTVMPPCACLGGGEDAPPLSFLTFVETAGMAVLCLTQCMVLWVGGLGGLVFGLTGLALVLGMGVLHWKLRGTDGIVAASHPPEIGAPAKKSCCGSKQETPEPAAPLVVQSVGTPPPPDPGVAAAAPQAAPEPHNSGVGDSSWWPPVFRNPFSRGA